MGRKIIVVITSLAALASGFRSTVFSQSGAFEYDPGDRGDRTSIILMGDPQETGFWERLIFAEQNDSAREALCRSIADEDPAFLVLLGDLVSNGGMESRWKYCDQFVKPVRDRQIPVYAIPGNHEYFGRRGEGLKQLALRFPASARSIWHSVRYRNIAVVLLNSNFSKMTPDEVDTQTAWYESTLKRYQKDDSITAIIVCCHHPPMTNSKIVSGNADVRREFVKPFLRSSKARLFVSGHCHSYERFSERGKMFVVTGGGGGARHKVIIDSSKQRHRDFFLGPEKRPFHYCKVLLEDRRLRVQIIGIDTPFTQLSVVDEFDLETTTAVPQRR